MRPTPGGDVQKTRRLPMEHTPDSIDEWASLERWFKVYTASLYAVHGLFSILITTFVAWLGAPLLVIALCGITPVVISGGVYTAMRAYRQKRMREIGPKLDAEYPEREALIEESEGPLDLTVQFWLEHRRNGKELIEFSLLAFGLAVVSCALIPLSSWLVVLSTGSFCIGLVTAFFAYVDVTEAFKACKKLT